MTRVPHRMDRIFTGTVLTGNFPNRGFHTEPTEHACQEVSEIREALAEPKHRVIFRLDMVNDQRPAMIRCGTATDSTNRGGEAMLAGLPSGHSVTVCANVLLTKRYGRFRSVHSNNRVGEHPVLYGSQQSGRIGEVFCHA